MQREDNILDSISGPQMRRSANRNFEYSLYLKKTFRDILPRVLSEVCQVRPADPIEYLATLLYKAADSDMYFQEKAVFAKEMHAVASQMKQEDERRQHSITLYKRQIHEFKRFVDTRHSPRLLPSTLALSARKYSAAYRKRGTSFNVPESTIETVSELEPLQPDLKDDLAGLKSRRATFVDMDHPSSHSSGSARVSPVTPDTSSRRTVVSVSSRSDHLIGTPKTFRASPSAKPRLLPKYRQGFTDKTGYSSSEELGTKKGKQAKQGSDQKPVSGNQSFHTPSPISASRPAPTTQAKKKPPRDTEIPSAERPSSDRARHKTRREKVTTDAAEPETAEIAKVDTSSKAKTKEGRVRDKKLKGVTIFGRQNLLRAQKPFELKPPSSFYWLPPGATDSLGYVATEEEHEEGRSSESQTTTGVGKMRKHSDEPWTEKSPRKSKAEASESPVEDESDSEDGSIEIKSSDLEDEDQSPGRIVSLADLDDKLEITEGETSEAAKVAPKKKMKYKAKKATDEAVGVSAPPSPTRDVRSISDEDLSSKDELILEDDQYLVKSVASVIEEKRAVKKPVKLSRPLPKKQPKPISDAGGSQEITTEQENVVLTKPKRKGRKGQYAVDSGEDTSEQMTPQRLSTRNTFTKDGASRRSTLGATGFPQIQGSFSQERKKRRGKEPTDTSERVSRSGKGADASPGNERDGDVTEEDETRRKVRKRQRRKKITDESEPEPEMTDVDILVPSSSAENKPVETSSSKLFFKKTTKKQRPKAAKGKMLTRPSFSSVALEPAEQMNELDEFEGSICEDEAESTETIPMPSVGESSETPEDELPFTPVECEWYLVGARTLVCQHPVLGEIQAKGPAPASSQDFTGWMEAADYVWQSFYDSETYTLQNPWADDKTKTRRRTRVVSTDVKKQSS